MALTKKSGPAQAVNLVGDFQNPPPIPQTVLDRFPEMIVYQKSLTEWWINAKTLLQRDLGQIQATFTAQQAAIADLQARVTKLGG